MTIDPSVTYSSLASANACSQPAAPPPAPTAKSRLIIDSASNGTYAAAAVGVAGEAAGYILGSVAQPGSASKERPSDRHFTSYAAVAAAAMR